MRWLIVLVWVMGVLIVVGCAVVAATIVQRLGPPSPAQAASLVLDEPPGTRIAGVAALGDRLAITLTGGGPDRIAIVDLRHNAPPARVSLSH